MSVWPRNDLHTNEGELLCVSVTVKPRNLEYLLETLAESHFPIDPQIFHRAQRIRPSIPPTIESATLVEFPSYATWLRPLAERLHEFDPTLEIQTVPMLDRIGKPSIRP